ncbi:MAG: ABC transporter ATP-binding protein [Spirochaetaceae bacterium]|jgi:ABC-type Fe3+/spermidine/putrescine transport system ATPase subunit|nr:ABC transporter ATP-binding protein [Spirochaetaceae bacterium]
MALEVRGLQKQYNDFSVDIDFLVADGETLVLAGPSGCGKTTVLNLIAGFVEEDAGIILINGKPLNHLPPWERYVSVVFQDLALFPHLNVGNNIGYGPFIRGVSRRERKTIVEEALKIVRLSGYAKRRIHTLSGGERQRVAIARALATEPRALLLDEPFSSLDAPLRRELRKEFREIGTKSPIPRIFVTHDREEAAVLGDRIALMSGGRILETGSARELFLAPKTEFGARFFGAGLVFPCTITGETQDGWKITSPLGELLVPRGSSYDSQKPLVFIPQDALSPAGEELPPGLTAGKGENPVLFTARFKQEFFEGERMILEAELPGGALLRALGRLRMELPPKNSLMRWHLAQGLIRFVLPS